MKITAFEKRTFTGDTVEAEEEVTANEYNQFFSELHNAIENSGQTLSETNVKQLSEAMARNASGGVFYQDLATTPNAFVLQGLANFKLPSAYFEGMMCLFRANMTNTAGVTVNVSGLGIKQIFDENGGSLPAGAIVKNQFVVLIYSGSKFILPTWSNCKNFLNQPTYPEILTNTHTLSLTANGGQISVDSEQSWLYRGFKKYNSSDYAVTDRTFSTEANKTYHLRWTPNGFALKDLADPAYNSVPIVETDPAFDTNYDNMLVARIVTNSMNIATVTPLINKSDLYDVIILSGAPTVAYVGNGSQWTKTVALNWARTPLISLALQRANISPGYDADQEIASTNVSRYHFNVFALVDFSTLLEVSVTVKGR